MTLPIETRRLTTSTSSTCQLHQHRHRRNNMLTFISPTLATAPSPSSPSPTAPPPFGVPVSLTALTPAERCVHVFAATTTNLLNGFIFGGLFGLVSGAWSKRNVRAALAEANSNGKSWATISAVYAGLQTAAKVIRQKDDKYNAIVGACGSGAAFSLKNGPASAAQGCVTFAALSYFLDSLTASKTPPEMQSDEEILRKK